MSTPAAAAGRRSPQAALRGSAYLMLHAAARSGLRARYREFLRQDRERDYPDTGELLAETLEHAVATVPHYRGLVDPAEIRADPFAALARFPPLRRRTTRDSFAELLSETGNRSEWVETSTGGSTGEPVRLLQDPRHLALTVAVREVYSTWAGGTLGAPELYVWGSPWDLDGGEDPRKRFGNWLLRRTMLDAFNLTEASIEAIVGHLRDTEPQLVVAYAQAGYEVARFCARQEVELPPQRGLITTATTLHDFMRERLEATFGCPVLNRYGSRETGDIAGECEHRNGLHVLPWICHVEVLDSNGEPVAAGEAGEIAVTGFTNRAMPLIRYVIGDRARLPAATAECPCGRRTQMLAEVTGRTVDTFVAADGHLVDGAYFARLLYVRPWVRRFQAVQKAPDRVVFRIVVASEPPAADLEQIVARTRDALGAGCEVEFERLDSIAPSRSGKLRYTTREF